jgi:RNA polymerase sigma factor (sigma-70 family)
MTVQIQPDPLALAGPPGNENDAGLIRRSQQDPEQFAELFRRHAPAIQRYAARRLGPGAAEDIVAEVFLAAFRQRGRYLLSQPDARPWLYGIATNLIGERRRAEVRMYRAYARSGADPLAAEGHAQRVVEVVSAEAESPRLAAALASLKKRDRDALLLFTWGDLSYEEVARALDVPVGTVRSRLNRARRKLRAALGTPTTSED